MFPARGGGGVWGANAGDEKIGGVVNHHADQRGAEQQRHDVDCAKAEQRDGGSGGEAADDHGDGDKGRTQ